MVPTSQGVAKNSQRLGIVVTVLLIWAKIQGARLFWIKLELGLFSMPVM